MLNKLLIALGATCVAYQFLLVVAVVSHWLGFERVATVTGDLWLAGFNLLTSL